MAFLKRNKDKKFDSSVPEFSESASTSSEVPKYPNYEKEFGTIKKEISKPVNVPKVEIPTRKKGVRAAPAARERIDEDKPVFIKIDSYKEARDSVDKIKELVHNAGHLLEEVHKIKENEDRELENWHNNLDKLKNKLLDVDKKLFDL
jgi:hypothetical protein